MKAKVGIIGYGRMGSAIAERIREYYEVIVFDTDSRKISGLTGLTPAADIAALAQTADTLILAVKPQDFEQVLPVILAAGSGNILIISIAAGVTLGYLRQALGHERLIRAMPNLAARIGRGVTAITCGADVSGEDIRQAERIFQSLGATLTVGEEMMDAVTAVSGSGPGFLCALLEEQPRDKWQEFAERVFIVYLREAALHCGFDEETASLLVEETARGTLDLLEITGISPAELRSQVTSKGGTTAAGLQVLQGNIHNLVDAVGAARARAQELSKR
ncbi:MAG: pyrroline-5-carboxylate reductase [Candidatus Omnitrophica bacterium]|nr:pyrroline-5-carboxylate reductase [Candidatus Omnitrophota bacterium]